MRVQTGSPRVSAELFPQPVLGRVHTCNSAARKFFLLRRLLKLIVSYSNSQKKILCLILLAAFHKSLNKWCATEGPIICLYILLIENIPDFHSYVHISTLFPSCCTIDVRSFSCWKATTESGVWNCSIISIECFTWAT